MLKPDYRVCLTVVRVGLHMSVREAFGALGRPCPPLVVDQTEAAHRASSFDELERLLASNFRPFFSKGGTVAPKPPMVSLAAVMGAARGSSLYDVLGDGAAMGAYVLHANAKLGRAHGGTQTASAAIGRANERNNPGGPLFVSLLADTSDLFSRVDIVAFHLDMMRTNEESVRQLKSPVMHVFGFAIGCVAASPQPPAPGCLPKPVRTALWARHFGTSSATGCCLCCQREITWDNFECGHVVSRANGGSDHLANLLPVCGACNRGMGRENLTDFRTRYFADVRA